MRDFMVLAILDKIRIHARVLNLKYLQDSWDIDHSGQNPRSKKVRVYHHKKLKYLGLPLEMVIEKKGKNKKNKKKVSKKKEFVLREYTISVNPSRLGDFETLINILNELLANCGKDYVIGQVDFSLLLPKEIFSLELLAKAIYVSGKQITREFYHLDEQLLLNLIESPLGDFYRLNEDYLNSLADSSLKSRWRDNNFKFKSGRMTGYYNGTYPEIFLMYDVEILTQKEKKKGRFNNKLLTTEPENLSGYHKRFLTKYGNKLIVFEKRIHSKILKGYNIRYVEDLHKLITIKPFGNIKFMDWFLDDVSTRRNAGELIIVMLECMTRGYHQARNLLNKQNNFHRYEKNTFKPVSAFTEQVSLTSFFNKAYSKGMDRYFSGQKIDKCHSSLTRLERKELIFPMSKLFPDSIRRPSSIMLPASRVRPVQNGEIFLQ